MDDLRERNLGGSGLATAVRAAMAWIEPEKSFPALVKLLDPIAPIAGMSVTVTDGEVYRHLFDHPGGPADEKVSAGMLPLAGTLLEDVYRDGRAVMVRDPSGSGFERDAELFPYRGRAWAILPILDEGTEQVIATLNVSFADADALNARSMGILVSVAEWGAIGIRNAIMFDEQRNAVRELREREQLKDDLIAMLAHDLRGPLSVIFGSAETLEERWDRVNEEQKLQLVRSIARKGRFLHQLAVEALHEAHLASDEFGVNMQPFDVAGVIELAVEGLEREGVARIRVTRDEVLPAGVGDPLRHWQILSNLLSNALKFSAPGGLVDVDAAYVDGLIQISVKDAGPGVASEDLDKVFQRFWRPAHTANGHAAAAAGTGLGLYICKRLVEAQGGTIWVESAPGQGAAFYYTVPPAG